MTERDYSETLFLPKTDFPMRAGLPQKEPDLLARWQRIGLGKRLRAAGKGRRKFVLHDGPPYANGNIHIGHALNKILKDIVARSQRLLGRDSDYVPGWDCHGLPIEWKIEEQYRAKGRNKDDVPINEFRQECRTFAAHWIDVQREEFKRLGVEGDWEHPYTTMHFAAEAQIARELMKFAGNGTLYRGSKPVMWSVVEKTALAEAEVEYEDHTSDTVWVKFPVDGDAIVTFSAADKGDPDAHAKAEDLRGAAIVIWTTTPWTLPANRAISYSPKITYGLYEVTDAPEGNWAKRGDKLILADKLAADVFKTAKVTAYERRGDVNGTTLYGLHARHPLNGKGYDFLVPLLSGDHVTDDTGTGFVHTAPGHGRDDFDIWTANSKRLAERKIVTAIPYTVDADGFFTAQAPGFTGARVINEKGEKGNANDVVIKALVEAGMLLARGRLKHQYPHSWRSKKPLIFRNTPQWFIAMDQAIADDGGSVRQGDTLRARALTAIKQTRWVPEQGENRINGMVAGRPDWVISRQRAWGVPITVFVRERGDGSAEILHDAEVDARIASVFEKEGADAWYAEGARERFLGPRASEDWVKVDDILDVWFDSGSTYAFVLEDPEHFPALAGIRRKAAGGDDEVMYLEGSDQHRGWFQSSLLESCGTRGSAPFDLVLTHGFVLDEHGRKMSKSLGNVTSPQDVIKQAGADILRLWVAASDYSDDLRIGKEILKTTTDTYRKLRNTLRWMLGSLAHFSDADRVAFDAMPELERYMLHELAAVEASVLQAYAAFDYKRVLALLIPFMTIDLSAFYFDIRKDVLYCDPISSPTRRACLTVLDHIFRRTIGWLAPVLCFTAEETWLARHPSEEGSVHLEDYPQAPSEDWRNDDLAKKWATIRAVRRVVTGALEIERAAKRIGTALEAAPAIYVSDAELRATLADVDLAEVCITSAARLETGVGPDEAFRLKDVPGVVVVVHRAEGRKCARSWKVLPDIGADPDYPDVSPRDAKALREWEAMRKQSGKAAE